MANNNYKRVSLNLTSLIAAEMTVNGNYLGKADLLVEGIITGDVKIKGAIMVAENGSVNGNVEADYAVIAGKVGGDVIAAKAAEVKPTGDIGGNLFAREVLIASRGKVTGDIGAAKKQVVTYEMRVNVEDETTGKITSTGLSGRLL